MLDIKELHERLLSGTALDPDLGLYLIPENLRLTSDELYREHPRRHRGTFDTNRLSAFVAYCQNAAGDIDLSALGGQPTLFLDGPRALAVFDQGTDDQPRWGDHRALLTLEPSPPFAALRKLLDRPLTQDLLIGFIDDWSDLLSFQRPDGSVCTPETARAELADLTVEAVRTMRTKQTEFAREKTGLERLSLGAGLPTLLLLTCAPFEELTTEALRIRLTAREHSGSLALHLTHAGWPLLEERLTAELEARLRATLHERGAFRIYRGSFTA